MSDDTKLLKFEQFYKNKASHRKHRQLNCCFVSLIYFLSILSVSVTNMPFIEALAKLRICLFCKGMFNMGQICQISGRNT